MTSSTTSRGRTNVLMVGVQRRFGTVVALGAADLEVREGEVHAVLGENGAGKSTLMRILAGLDRPDDGEVVVGGLRVDRFDPQTARQHGVAIVQQHFTLVPTLDAADNLTLARPLRRLRPRRSDAEQRLRELSDRYGLEVRAGTPAGELSVGEQQRLEVLRALDAGPRVLVLDEPTAMLTDAEATRLLDVCHQLADEGRSVVIVTHRMAEVSAAADRVTVLRGGRTVLDDEPVSGRTKEELARLMVGVDAPTRRPAARRRFPSGPYVPARLAVHGLTVGALRSASFAVAPGRVLGIAGVDGNGQAELEGALAGRLPADSGTIELDGRPITLRTPAERVDGGIGYITSDRYRWGLVGDLDLADNVHLGRLPRWLPSRRDRQRDAAPRLADWDVRGNGPNTPASALSGGNAQKVVLARELGGDPGLVLACHPTRGLDPEAAAGVSRRVLEQAAGGAAIVWVGSELDELFEVADEILVASAGRLVGPFHPPYDRLAIGLAMTGEAELEVAS